MRRWGFAAPSLVAVVLSLPLIGLGYVWDDYFFLTRAQQGVGACLEYVKGAAFYRPLTQGIYFLPLAHAGGGGALASHVVNVAALAGSAWLLARLIARHPGARAGTLAGLLFAVGSQNSTVVVLEAKRYLLSLFNLPITGSVIGTYARGVAATGEPERAVRILERIAATEPDPLVRSYDLRLAAMVLFDRCDEAGAGRLLATAAPLPRDFALDAIARVLLQPTRSPALDAHAYSRRAIRRRSATGWRCSTGAGISSRRGTWRPASRRSSRGIRRARGSWRFWRGSGREAWRRYFAACSVATGVSS